MKPLENPSETGSRPPKVYSRVVTDCRACKGTALTPVFDQGRQPLANAFKAQADSPELFFPLQVLLCRNCGLAQLSEVVRPEILYHDYPYVTSHGRTMTAHLQMLMHDFLKPSGNDRVLEIGSNDGYFLRLIQQGVNQHVGVEPDAKLAEVSRAAGITTYTEFFNSRTAQMLARRHAPFDVIFCRHVFAHVDDWDDFFKGLDAVSDEKTLVCIEVPFVMDQLENNSFDQIYHEHLSYVNGKALEIFSKNFTRFRLFKVKHYNVQGGSIVACFEKRDLAQAEPEFGDFQEPNSFGSWMQFQDRALNEMKRLKALVDGAVQAGKTVAGYGASAKATVWLNACGFRQPEISAVLDSTPAKQGKFVPGTDIPIIRDDAANVARYDYLILFAWNYGSEIMAKHPDFTGKWVIPVPHITIK